MRIGPLLLIACTALIVRRIAAQDNVAPGGLQVPARTVPVPTDVSPELQKIIAAPRRAGWDKLWKTGEEWRAAANELAAKTLETLPAMRERLHVTVKPTMIDGVRAFVVTPDVIPPEHRDKVLIHVHGGCYVLSPGEAGTGEAILMAGIGHFKVISVDYRMPPEAYFPAALDDAMTVYKSVLKTSNPKNTAVFGTSAGGALVLEMMLRAKQLGIPLPSAIAPALPWPTSRRLATASTRTNWLITFWSRAMDSATRRRWSTPRGTISAILCFRPFTGTCTASRRPSSPPGLATCC